MWRVWDRRGAQGVAKAGAIWQDGNKEQDRAVGFPAMLRPFLAVVAGLAAVIYAALPAGADDVSPHMVRVQDIDPSHLITVQVDPVEQAKYMAEGWTSSAPVKPTVLPPVDGNAQQAAAHPGGGATGTDAIVRFAPHKTSLPRYDWYWNIVPVGLYDGVGRFQTALAALGEGPGGATIAAPRMQAMQDLASTWGTEIMKDTVGTQVSPALVLAVMAVESGGDASALSPVGAQGLMQLIPDTAKRFGVSDPMDGAQSIRGRFPISTRLMGRFDRDPVMVLAAYNAGAGAVSAPFGRAALSRDAGLRAEGSRCLEGRAGPVPDPARAGQRPLRVPGAFGAEVIRAADPVRRPAFILP